MTSRFERFMLISLIILIGSALVLPILVFPSKAAAQEPEQNKQRQVFEIKNFPRVYIPDVETIQKLVDPSGQEVEAGPIEVEKTVAITTVEIVPVTVKPITSIKELPPRVAGDERIYMHEPEIRAYICPKMGQKNCNIFIAILKAENGTHECTRDNRGLNKNGSVDVGLAQINWNPKYNPPYTYDQLQDCKFNLNIALKKYEARGFQPWYAYTKGAYKKFLKPTPVVSAAIIQ